MPPPSHPFETNFPISEIPFVQLKIFLDGLFPFLWLGPRGKKSLSAMATPPPVHSSSVIIGPPDEELTKLAWYQFLEKRAVGRGVGLGLMALSATSFSLLLRPWNWLSSSAVTKKASQSSPAYVIVPVAIGIASLVAGIRLRTGMYFKDPEAMREYLQLYHSECFSEAYKQLGGMEGLRRSTRTS